MNRTDTGTAMIIGAGSGIGRALACVIAARGMHVTAADIDGSAAMETARIIRTSGGVADAAQVDACDPDQLEALASACRAAPGHAGINLLAVTVGAIVDRPLEAASAVDWAWMLDLNLMAHVRSVAAFLPALRTAAGRRGILLVSSMGGVLEPGPADCGGAHLGLYIAAKHALVGYAGVLRHELAGESIGVSVALPTRVAGNLEQTSRAHRPAQYGGPADTGARPPPRTGLLPAEEAARRLLAGFDHGRFCLFTCPDSERALRAQFEARLMDMAASTQAP